MAQDIRFESPAVRPAQEIMMLGMTSMSKVILHTDHLLLSVNKAIVDQAEPFELHNGVLLAEARTENIVDDVIPSRYLSKRLHAP